MHHGGLVHRQNAAHRPHMFRKATFALFASLAIASAEEREFLKNTRQLTYEGKRAGEAYFHPDGNLLIFQSEREEGNPFYQIYLLDLLSGESARVSPGIGKTTCSFFRPGTSRVLYASTHHDPQAKEKMKAEIEFRASGKQRRYAWDYDETMDIFTANQDGTQIVQLTKEKGYDAEGAFSPTGDEIVFCSNRSGYELLEPSPADKSRLEKDPAYYGEIYRMNADGTEVVRLTNAPGYDGGPFFSPGGSRICWRRFDESGMVADVYTMNRIGGDVRRLTNFGSMSWAPYYHPSEQYLVFTANKLGFENFELFIVDAQGKKEPVRITTTDGFDGLPVFSPKGDKLCWTSNRTADNKSQLFMADWSHQAALNALAKAPERAAEVAKVSPKATSGSAPGSTSVTVEHVKSDGTQVRDPKISAEDLRAEVGWLADPAREGRATGTEGAKTSADWIAEEFRKAGLSPLPGAKNAFNEFEFRAGERIIPDKNALKVNDKSFAVEKDFRPLAFSESAEAEGEVVFAGYGLNVPEGQGQKLYNSYEGIDVKDKIVLLMRYVPESVEQARRAHLNRYAGLRYKVMMARERGAKGVLVVTGPNSPNAGELLPLTNDGSSADSGLPALSITAAVADALLAGSGKTLKDLQTGLDNENPHVEGAFVLPKTKAKFATGIEHIRKTDRNVLAWLPGTTDEYVIVGAHYDHLGVGGSGSLAKSGEEKKPHVGADDNASGTAVVLEMAAAMAAQRAEKPDQFKRGVLFALWSGEEIGLIGSSAFAEKPPMPLDRAVAYVNFDMVGRMRDNKLVLQAVGSSKMWPKLIEKRNVAAGFALTLQEDPYLPTDVTALYPKRIPCLNFFTGSHEDYHRPSDTADKLDYDGMARIAVFAKNIVNDLVSGERPDFSRVERKETGGGSRETLRAYMGSIPDYAQEVKGVKLSGVRGGSPAEKGGLQGGDVIVEFAGQKIANIYDYTYALDAVKIGQPVKILVERGGKRVEVTVTPEARK
jgi:Tol biopolymer transport system component